MNKSIPHAKPQILLEDYKKILNLIMDLESLHNDPCSYASLLEGAVVQIEPEGIRLSGRAEIEAYRIKQIDKKVYAEFAIEQQIILNENAVLLTCTETIIHAFYRGMQTKSIRLYNILLRKSENLWRFYSLQILNI